MTCYKPLQGFQLPNGKLTTQYRAGLPYLEVPCGYCIGCRLDRSKAWAIRCTHEAQMHEANSFLTLTYSENKIPEGGSLEPMDMVWFMKRLRKRLWPRQIRFFQCGEYGERLERPHHHVLVFGYDFPDKYFWTQRGEHSVYRSELLEQLWPFGFSEIGTVSRKSAGYVARYIMKKVTGERALQHYYDLDKETGELRRHKRPEYITMSRRPGIGRTWLEKYWRDVYPSDQVVIDGTISKPPIYYDRWMEVHQPEIIEEVRKKREAYALEHEEDNTPKRLREREFVKEAQAKMLSRNLEETA